MIMTPMSKMNRMETYRPEKSNTGRELTVPGVGSFKNAQLYSEEGMQGSGAARSKAPIELTDGRQIYVACGMKGEDQNAELLSLGQALKIAKKSEKPVTYAVLPDQPREIVLEVVDAILVRAPNAELLFMSKDHSGPVERVTKADLEQRNVSAANLRFRAISSEGYWIPF